MPRTFDGLLTTLENGDELVLREGVETALVRKVGKKREKVKIAPVFMDDIPFSERVGYRSVLHKDGRTFMILHGKDDFGRFVVVERVRKMDSSEKPLFPNALTENLGSSLEGDGGLFLVCGKPCSGKTSVAGSLKKEISKKFGAGFCILHTGQHYEIDPLNDRIYDAYEIYRIPGVELESPGNLVLLSDETVGRKASGHVLHHAESGGVSVSVVSAKDPFTAVERLSFFARNGRLRTANVLKGIIFCEIFFDVKEKRMRNRVKYLKPREGFLNMLRNEDGAAVNGMKISSKLGSPDFCFEIF